MNGQVDSRALDSPSQDANTSSAQGTYYVGVWSPSGSAGDHTITFDRQ